MTPNRTARTLKSANTGLWILVLLLLGICGCSRDPVPEDLGWYIVADGELTRLKRSDQVGAGGTIGHAVYGLKELSPITVDDADAHFVVYATDAANFIEGLQLSRLSYEGERMVRDPNLPKLLQPKKPSRLNLYTAATEIPVGMRPVEGNERMFRVIPKEPLTPGPFALHKGPMVGEAWSKPEVYDFQVGGAPSAEMAELGVVWSSEHAIPLITPIDGGGRYSVLGLAFWRTKNRYHLLYLGSDSNVFGDHFLGYADSEDGYNWRRAGNVQGIDDEWVIAGVYTLQDRHLAVISDGTILASEDGLNWHPEGSVSVPGRIVAYSYRESQVSRFIFFTRREAEHRLWFTESDDIEGTTRLGYMVSTNGTDWKEGGMSPVQLKASGGTSFRRLSIVWDGAKWIAFAGVHQNGTVFGQVECYVASEDLNWRSLGVLIPRSSGRCGRRTTQPLAISDDQLRLLYSCMEESGNSMSILFTAFTLNEDKTSSLPPSDRLRDLQACREKQWLAWNAIDSGMASIYRTRFFDRRSGRVNEAALRRVKLAEAGPYSWILDPAATPEGIPSPTIDAQHFKFLLIGDLDDDPTLDTWLLTDEAFRREGHGYLLHDDCIE